MEFKDKLYQLRKEKGMSQEELAILCNVSRQAISKWENGTSLPDFENLKMLSKTLQVSIDELLGNTKETQKEVIKEKEIIYVHHRYWFEKKYRSKFTIFGIPLIDINIGRGREENGYWRVAKGIIAIGNVSIGVFSFGILSAGICSIGILALGLLFAIAPLCLSYFAIGALAIGYISIGALAIGVYSIGALSIGFHVGIGALAYGPIAVGTTPMGDIMYHLRNTNACFLDATEYQNFQTFLDTQSLPDLIEFLLRSIPKC